MRFVVCIYQNICFQRRRNENSNSINQSRIVYAEILTGHCVTNAGMMMMTKDERANVIEISITLIRQPLAY